jgi:hypothetical protein
MIGAVQKRCSNLTSDSMKLPYLFRALAFALVASLPVRATDMSVTGNLSDDNNVQFFSFPVFTESLVTIQTVSYAGGVTASGTIIPRGGFDPILGLFNSSGARLAVNDEYIGAPVDPVSGGAFDSQIQQTLTPGTYTVSISQFANFPGPTITTPFPSSGTSGFFDPITQTQRTSFFAFGILNINVPPPTGNVPDSGSALVLLSFAFLTVAGIRRKVVIS